jgi:hypothetical protein
MSNVIALFPRDHRKTTARPMATRVSDIQFKVEAMGAAIPTTV